MHDSPRTAIESLHEKIRACRLCEQGGFPISPPPLVFGLAPAPFMLIGQAPGLTDLRVGRMYRGPAARKLISWLIEAGFTNDDIGTTIYLTALTKCFPGRLPGKSTDRAPSARERANCRPWLDNQLALVKPAVLILFGKMAIDLYLPGRPLTETIGTVFEVDANGKVRASDGIPVPHYWGGGAGIPLADACRTGPRIIVPLPHSSGASLWLNDAENQARVRRAIENLARIREAMSGAGDGLALARASNAAAKPVFQVGSGAKVQEGAAQSIDLV